MLNNFDKVLLAATICFWALSNLYLVWRVIKMANISFTVNISISPAASPLAAVTDPLNLSGQVGVPFTASLADNIKGGTKPYTLSVSGTPPAGLSVDASGNITGTPTTEGTSTLSVSVNDSAA